MTLVIDWSKPRSKEEISADIKKIIEQMSAPEEIQPLPNPAMKGFQPSRAAKSLYEAWEEGEYNVQPK